MALDPTSNTAWPMFRHDPRHTGHSPAIGPREPRMRWLLHIGDYVRSSPVVGDDATVYAGSWDHHLHAVGPDGVQLWSSPTLDHIVGAAAVGPDGTKYVGS